jgi:5-(carboxyamino)imidazole ribonucleotide synthase
MMVAPAAALGINLLLFAQSPEDSGAQICSHTVGDYTDLSALKDFASTCDVVTPVDELIPLSVVKGLESSGIRVYPPSSALIYSHNREKLREELSSHSSPSWKVATSTEVFESEIVVMVARSPHGQATSWTTTQTVQEAGEIIFSISPAQVVSEELSTEAQRVALNIARELGVVGVMAVEIFVDGENLSISQVAMGPHISGLWTIDGSRTSQFEQHLRAILDLPLGDPSMTSEFAVMGSIAAGDKPDMYRPYLHLMARNPDLKFHQYRNAAIPGATIGHVTAIGTDLQKLCEDVKHARDYMSAAIDE